MRKIFILVCSSMLLASCGNSSKANKAETADSTATTVIDMHNAETSLDYEGTYKGVFPAADCPGIDVILTLNADKTFTQHYSYMERNTSFDEKGAYTLKGNLLTLKTDSGEISYFKVGENHLRKLNADKEEITGEMADNFILTKE